jgi:predicted O-methyltransferase YrrM
MLDQIVKDVLPISMQSRERVVGLLEAVDYVLASDIPGDFVECGVYRGASAIAVRKRAPKMKCWLYDTFDGMTEPTEEDTSRKGRDAREKWSRIRDAGQRWLAVSAAEVWQNLRDCGVADENYLRFVVGDVCNTLREPANLPEQIAILRLDTDWHESTKVELEVLYPRLAPGGVLIVDDFGYWYGARKAVEDYFREIPGGWRITEPSYNNKYRLRGRMYDSTGLEVIKPRE